ncbi:hypothetical protein [Streptomyces indicus]|nr:hypothetical protein [Streptomyces indicus]
MSIEAQRADIPPRPASPPPPLPSTRLPDHAPVPDPAAADDLPPNEDGSTTPPTGVPVPHRAPAPPAAPTGPPLRADAVANGRAARARRAAEGAAAVGSGSGAPGPVPPRPAVPPKPPGAPLTGDGTSGAAPVNEGATQGSSPSRSQSSPLTAGDRHAGPAAAARTETGRTSRTERGSSFRTEIGSSFRTDTNPDTEPETGRTPPGPETPAETTTRLRPVTAGPLPPETARRPVTGASRPGLPAAHGTAPPRHRRPVGSVDLTPRPDAGPPLVFMPPAAFDDHTTRLRPVRRSRARVAAAATCLVLGVGLITGAVTGSWLTGESGAASRDASVFAAAADAWHSQPVDTLFPPTVVGDGAGPGGADRRWTRLGVAPDTTCAKGLDPMLRKALEPAGCARLVRATYTDATRSHVTTVGMVFTKADAEAMGALRTRFAKEGLAAHPDLMPLTHPVKGTVAEGFGPRQRASWSVSVLSDAPVVVFAVSGFADGRTVDAPEPAAKAMAEGATSAPAQSGLGHEAKGLADRIERGLRKKAAEAAEEES